MNLTDLPSNKLETELMQLCRAIIATDLSNGDKVIIPINKILAISSGDNSTKIYIEGMGTKALLAGYRNLRTTTRIFRKSFIIL
jgi:hypothetical protein